MTVMRGSDESWRICAGCRTTRLSRYNPEMLCSSCMRATRAPPEIGGDRSEEQVPTWAWDSPMLRAALARIDLAAVMVICRVSAGLSQLEFGHLLGCSQATIWRLEAGKRQSLYDIRELLRFADSIGMPRRVLLPLILGDKDLDDKPGPDDIGDSGQRETRGDLRQGQAPPQADAVGRARPGG